MVRDDRYYFKEIRKILKSEMTKSRYEHTLGVEFTSASLAMAHSGDIFKSELAGLLHDCAKCIPHDEQYRLCHQYHIVLNEAEQRNPVLIHGKLGAYLCAHKYKITDNEILSAITFHTTGRPKMSLLEKIVYIADYIEPRRDKAPNLTSIRTMAFSDLDEAVYLVVKDTLDYESTNNPTQIDPRSYDTFEYYKKIHLGKI